MFDLEFAVLGSSFGLCVKLSFKFLGFLGFAPFLDGLSFLVVREFFFRETLILWACGASSIFGDVVAARDTSSRESNSFRG